MYNGNRLTSWSLIKAFNKESMPVFRCFDSSDAKCWGSVIIFCKWYGVWSFWAYGLIILLCDDFVYGIVVAAIVSLLILFQIWTLILKVFICLVFVVCLKGFFAHHFRHSWTFEKAKTTFRSDSKRSSQVGSTNPSSNSWKNRSSSQGTLRFKLFF